MDRVTVSEAAERLGVTQDAIRQRVKRGTIQYDKESDGRVYVYLDPTKTVRQDVHDKSRDELVGALRDQVETLKSEVAAWREEARRKDHLLAAALERIPALEPPEEEPSDARESSVTASEEEGKSPAPPEPETAESQSWWRRIFK